MTDPTRRWRDQASANMATWGNQNPSTVLLAAIEELGEVAMALDDQADPPADIPPGHREDVTYALGLIHRMAALGRDTRRFLEQTYTQPAGEDGPNRVDDLPIRGDIRDADPIQNEIDDLGPLLIQMGHALQDGDDDD